MNTFTRFFFFLALVTLSNVSIAQTSLFWKSISAAEDYTVAIKYDGTLWAWGRNHHGQLGDGTTTNTNVPKQIGTDTDWMQASANGGHTAAVKTNGDLYVWGKNDDGQVGNTIPGIDVLTPYQITHQLTSGTTTYAAKFKAVHLGDGFTIAISLNLSNSVWGWGKNDKAQLGFDPSQLSNSLTPVQVPVPRDWLISTIYRYPTWYSFSVSKSHIVALAYVFGQTVALPTDPVEKEIIVSGDNNYAQLGTGNTDMVTTPIVTTPVDLVNDPTKEVRKFEKLATGLTHSIAIKRDGSLWVWGNNADGQLGLDPSTVTSYTVPTQITSNSDTWIDVETGNNFSVAIKSDGTLWTWGANDKGQLGNATTGANSWQPVQEASLSTDWEMLSTGDKFVFAVKKDGSIWAWGDNEYGQLGIGNQVNQNEPVMLSFSQFAATLEKVAGTSFPGLTKGAMAWGDYNNDGFLDLFFTGSGKTTSTANRGELWKNNGDNTFTKVETTVFQTMAQSNATWIDYNNDGLLDIFITGAGASNRASTVSKLYKNNGDGTFTEQGNLLGNNTTIPGIWNNSTKPTAEWADFNNDGFIDLIVSGGTPAIANAAKLYKNNGNGTFTEIVTPIIAPTPDDPNAMAGVPTSTNSTIIWIDYNGDGYKDLVIEGKGGSGSLTKLFKNNGNETFTEVTTVPFFNVENSGITWGDYNNDGYPDIVISGKISSVEYTDLYKNNGDGTFTKIVNSGLAGMNQTSVVMVDMNGDGLQDIVLDGYIGNSSSLTSVRYYKNNGDDTFSELPTPMMSVQTPSVTYADINNDGKPDIMVGGHNGTEGTTSLYLNISSGTATLPTVPQKIAASYTNDSKIKLNWAAPTTLSGSSKYNIRLGTASGKNDVISGLNNQQLIYASNAELSFMPNIVVDANKSYYFSVQVVDAAGNKSAWGTEYVLDAKVLPVVLNNFDVVKETNSVKITWSTSSETNNNRFEIERAGDDGKFVTIAIVKPSSNQGNKSYFTNDYRPLNGNNYYRLKQYDNDGESVTYETKIVNFSIATKASANVYPIPSNGNYINVSLNNFDNTTLALRVVDINGRIIHQQQLNNLANNTHRIDFSNKLNSGIYFIQLTGNQTKETVKIIVQ